MVQRNTIPEDVSDEDLYWNLKRAFEQSKPPNPETPYGATKTAELDVQFAIDPSFGLTKERYGWYSNDTLFDSTHFGTRNGKIQMKTGSTAGDIARLRSAFPGQYLPHSIAEPGLGANIPTEHLEYDDNNHVSLTHGEISLEVAQWSDTRDSANEAIGISFEPDATYFQIRADDENIAFIPQSEWNLDPMDGTGPSGEVLRPDEGYVYLFNYSWYGEGAYTLAVQNPVVDDIIPLHRYPPRGVNASVQSPNMPVSATVENKDTAAPLECVIGGMQYTTHGKTDEALSRTTEESRFTSGSYIDTEVVLTDNAVDPFAEPGRPLVALRRDPNNLRSRKGLRFSVQDLFLDAEQNCFLFIFDEYQAETALTGQTFTGPVSRGSSNETRIQTDTQATAYTPTDAVLRGIAYVSTSQKETQEITGDSTSNVPLEATAVVTVVLSQGANTTDAEPFVIEATEKF